MKKAAGIIGIIVALVLIVLGITTTVPDKYIKSYGDGKMYEYVGGDAYNYIVEASLRGGEIAGGIISKAIYFSVAAVLIVLSIAFLSANEDSGELPELRRETEEILEEIKKMNN